MSKTSIKKQSHSSLYQQTVYNEEKKTESLLSMSELKVIIYELSLIGAEMQELSTDFNARLKLMQLRTLVFTTD